MGGNALKLLGIQSRRIPSAEFIELSEKTRELTQSLFSNIQVVKAYETKPDHGDIDLVAVIKPGLEVMAERTQEQKDKGEAPKPLWVEELKAVTGTTGIYWNSPVASMELEGVQVDISGHLDPNKAKTRLEFSHYSPIGNVVGRMIRQTGAKWGVDGLTFPIRDTLANEGNLLGSVQLSIEMQDVFELAGLPSEPWEKGFKTQQEIMEWAAQSRLFNKEIFEFDNLNHINRKRDILRPDYHQWLEYTKTVPNKYERYKTPEEANAAKTMWFTLICQRFENLRPEWEAAHELKRLKSESKGKLNGKLIQSWTGLKGKELGQCIEEFKTTMGGEKQYQQWLIKTSEKKAEETFKSFYRKRDPEIQIG